MTLVFRCSRRRVAFLKDVYRLVNVTLAIGMLMRHSKRCSAQRFVEVSVGIAVGLAAAAV